MFYWNFDLICQPHGRGRTRTFDVSLWGIYSPLPSPLGYSPLFLLSRTAILQEDDASGALIILPQMITIFTNHQRLQAALSFCLVTLSFSATRYLESTFLLQFIYRKDLCPSQISIVCVL